MNAPAAGPSMTTLLRTAIALLAGHGHAVLAEAVRQSVESNGHLVARVEELTELLAAATQAADARAGMYRYAAEDTAHYRDTLRRIAKATSLEDAQRIANGALS